MTLFRTEDQVTEKMDPCSRPTRDSPLALVLLIATMSNTFLAFFVWIVLTPHLDNPVHWIGKLVSAVPVTLNIAALLLASRVWRRN